MFSQKYLNKNINEIHFQWMVGGAGGQNGAVQSVVGQGREHVIIPQDLIALEMPNRKWIAKKVGWKLNGTQSNTFHKCA